jgi:hypothetical protein
VEAAPINSRRSRLQIAVPEIEVDHLARLGGITPELASLETDAIEGLRVLA